MATTQLEWRRRWKPDLTAQIWQPFQLNRQRALVKCLFREDHYELLVYDMVTMWYEECSRAVFEQKAKKLNPNVEAPLATLLQHLRDNLADQRKKSTYSLEPPKSRDQSGMVLRLGTQLTGGVPFKWEFHCQEATNDMYACHLATPLLTMVSELSRREAELHKILKKKDAEIEDYKAAGGKVSRKHLETTPFDAKAFNSDMNFSKAFESQVQSLGASAFSEPGQELYRQVMMTNAWLNRPTEQASSDEEFSDDMSGDPGQTAGATGPSWAHRLPPSLVANAQTAGASYASPTKSVTPKGSPVKGAGSPGSSAEDTELLRRQALERRLAEEKAKQQQQVKKKKKKIF
ncbi:non-homologous end-joining factor 1-like [Acanthaster planci]|uniref:Non-homologous end-joining factor 1 n=1 Tax=Acanthaster planci TaxID=133434 RepID=A0A8B7YC71_ACAPL|nr:non-homologous end-joining factor 1-like [Acanthaster planci]XP_022090849.1 non-homologous end-joining factor 1-like [Acanthaster planci]XP_022090850.1 non-homologous end-joining factor 1-like [Acanthaster planci]